MRVLTLNLNAALEPRLEALKEDAAQRTGSATQEADRVVKELDATLPQLTQLEQADYEAVEAMTAS